MPPEGAKWVKNPQNRKKQKKAPMAPGKKILKNQQKIKRVVSREAFVRKRTIYHWVENLDF